MTRKHLVVIHGRSTKPSRPIKERFVRRALVAGLRRVDGDAAAAVESGRVPLDFVYYGDVANRLMLAAKPDLRRRMVADGDGWVEPAAAYEADLERLLARPTERHTREDYRRLLREATDHRYLDNLARWGSRLASVVGVGERVLRNLPDLGAYLRSRVVGPEIQERLRAPLRAALDSGAETAVLAHSMGTMVSWDVLWSLTHWRSLADTQRPPLSLWVTLGCPLGDRSVQRSLFGHGEEAAHRYPRAIRRWVNVAAQDDFVAHDRRVGDDFRAMRGDHAEELRDVGPIHTFWVGRSGMNPHKFYGYLNHPQVASLVADWLRP